MTISTSVKNHLKKQGIDFDLISHPRTIHSTDTALEAHVPGNRLAKAVIIRKGEDFIMVIIPSDEHVDLTQLNRLFAEPLDLASESELGQLIPDCSLGAVPAIGPVWGLDTYLDKSLLGLPEVFFEGGDHIELVRVSGDDFDRLLKDAERGHYGHTI